MYIANLTIETSEGTFNAGEEVKGLSSSDIARMTELGYITGKADKVDKTDKEDGKEEAPEETKKKNKR